MDTNSSHENDMPKFFNLLNATVFLLCNLLIDISCAVIFHEEQLLDSEQVEILPKVLKTINFVKNC